MINVVVGTKGNLETKITVGKEVVEPTLQTKTVIPTTSTQEVTFDKGYNGLGVVEVAGVTAEIDGNIKPKNILKGVEILGVKGNLEAEIIPGLYFYTGSDLCRDSSKEIAEFIFKHLKGITSQNGSLSNCFYNSGIETVYLERDYNFSNVKKFSQFFYGCANLRSFSGIGAFKMDSCTTLQSFFNGSSIEFVDFSVFDFSNNEGTIDMTGMFGSCSNLKEIINLDLSLATGLTNSFLFFTSNLENLTFKEGSTISQNSASNVTFYLMHQKKLTDDVIYKIFSDLGENTTGYARTFEIVGSVYNILSEKTKGLAESKGYTLKKY